MPCKNSVHEIRKLFSEEISNQNSEEHELLKTLCIQLFAVGYVEDTLLIWRAERKDFDTGCYIDVQLLCGAGINKTISYLKETNSLEVAEELEFLKKSIWYVTLVNFQEIVYLTFIRGIMAWLNAIL